MFAAVERVEKICVAVSPSSIRQFRSIAQSLDLRDLVEIVEGGAERPLSVKNCFDLISRELLEDDLICIHDAARPLLAKSDLDEVLEAGREHGAALLAARIKDTLKVVDESNLCVSTIDRTKVFAAQTPQVIKTGLLARAYAEVEDIAGVTDEIMLMERIGVQAMVVEPRHLNLKLTTPEDLELIEKFLS